MKVFVAGSCAPDVSAPENVIFLGNIKNQQELASYYALADVTILTSKRETFSMVTAESLCCGTPVAGFLAGAPEQIALREYSKFVEWGSVELLKDAAESFLYRHVNSYEVAALAKNRYSKQVSANRYCELYAELGRTAND